MDYLLNEHEHLWEDALIQAEKEHKDWSEWQEYQRSLQKPAKITIIKYDKIGDKSRELERVGQEGV